MLMRSIAHVLLLGILLSSARSEVVFRHQLEQYLGTLVAMDPTERVVIDDGFNQVAWFCNLCHADTNRRWQSPQIHSGGTSQWYQTVFGMVQTRASNAACYLKAWDQAHSNDTQSDKWEFDLTNYEWEINFDKYGKYKQKISQKFYEQNEDGNGTMLFTADSIVRVNATVGPWFNPGFLWTFKDAYLSGFGTVKTAMDFFFNDQNGGFNTILSGMVIMNNFGTNSTFYWKNGGTLTSSTSSNYPLNPYIFAWIIKKIPQQAEC